MFRVTTYLTVFPLLLLAIGFLGGISLPAADDRNTARWDMWGAEAERAAELDRVEEGRRHFHAFLKRLTRELAQGLPLSEAVDRVNEFTQDRYPLFLTALAHYVCDPNLNLRQKIAKNLMLHLEIDGRENPTAMPPARIADLHRQFETFQ